MRRIKVLNTSDESIVDLYSYSWINIHPLVEDIAVISGCIATIVACLFCILIIILIAYIIGQHLIRHNEYKRIN